MTNHSLGLFTFCSILCLHFVVFIHAPINRAEHCNIKVAFISNRSENIRLQSLHHGLGAHNINQTMQFYAGFLICCTIVAIVDSMPPMMKSDTEGLPYPLRDSNSMLFLSCYIEKKY